MTPNLRLAILDRFNQEIPLEMKYKRYKRNNDNDVDK